MKACCATASQFSAMTTISPLPAVRHDDFGAVCAIMVLRSAPAENTVKQSAAARNSIVVSLRRIIGPSSHLHRVRNPWPGESRWKGNASGQKQALDRPERIQANMIVNTKVSGCEITKLQTGSSMACRIKYWPEPNLRLRAPSVVPVPHHQVAFNEAQRGRDDGRDARADGDHSALDGQRGGTWTHSGCTGSDERGSWRGDQHTA